MSANISTQVLSFDNFGALENHLRTLKNKYNEALKKYEETLGYILRDTRPGNAKSQKVQEQWALNMQQALASSKTPATGQRTAAGTTNIAVRKDQKPVAKPAFGNGNGKDKGREESAGEWISLDPMSIFVGAKNKGLAEIYFETINMIRDSIGKINLALSICSTLKAKASTAGSTSLVVSFVNDIPTKVLFKPVDDSSVKKYAMTFSFAVASMPPAAQSYVLK